MAFVPPVTLRMSGLLLEPLTLAHEAGLAAAAADGELWRIRVTSVPEPQDTRAYIETALQMRDEGSRLAFAVIDEASEQPARRSGIRTVFSGLRIFDVSAMKCTPA